MNTVRNMILATLVVIAAALAAARPAAVQLPEEEAGENSSILKIEEWLILGPVATPFPAFINEMAEEGKASFLLSHDFIPEDELNPKREMKIEFPVSRGYSWRAVNTEGGALTIKESPAVPMTAYLASFIELSGWAELEFGAKSGFPFELAIDGKSIIMNEAEGSTEYHKGKAKLKRGKHQIIVKAVAAPHDSVVPWDLDAYVDIEGAKDREPVLSLSRKRNINIQDILEPPRIRDIELSPDGGFAAISIEKAVPPDGETKTVIEIRETKSGRLERTIVSLGGMGGFKWAPQGRVLSYTIKENDRTTIRTTDFETGKDRTVLKGIERFIGYQWSPDGRFVIYSAGREENEKEEGYKRLRGLSDRTTYGRRRSDLYLASANDQTIMKLTTGEYSSELADIHPDCEKIMVTRQYEDLSERPYGKTELVVIGLGDMEAEIMWEGRWFRGAYWSPEGNKILITAGPSAFGDTGRNVPAGIIPNDYDAQLYLFDPETGKAEAITKDFAPSVRGAFWPDSDGNIYIVAEDGPFVKLFRYSQSRGRIEPLRTACDVIERIDIPEEMPVALFSGSSAGEPQSLFKLNLKNGEETELLDPSDGWFDGIRKSRVEDWNFTTSSGKKIIGRIHYPPRFDSESKYPCIVYYYGGTSPVSRSFGGRYPKNLWASMGYVVLVLQPSGATGFGQEFSAEHVNDWGETVSSEIVEGTEKFLQAHPFIDSKRVGCIGASFGGFMTQLLVTRTDIFAAAVSHAGISSITSYWGEGFWGYAYNAVSAANSFPWNRPDIYVDRSPLFAADKVTTPLLLLHGDSDTNVPPGESEQMYTALKLLGKEVEYIKFAGQNHFILDYRKRIKWSDATIAWFDRWLKDQPQWWNDMYPPLNGAEESTGRQAQPVKMSARVIEDEKYGVFLVGGVSRGDIISSLPEWDSEYYLYELEMEAAAELMGLLDETEILCILGTWCSDSERMVPRLWKVLEASGFDISSLKMLAIASSRAEPDGGIPKDAIEWSDSVREYYNVKAVPTVIVKKGGKEAGRIIETVTESVERDLLHILEE